MLSRSTTYRMALPLNVSYYGDCYVHLGNGSVQACTCTNSGIGERCELVLMQGILNLNGVTGQDWIGISVCTEH